MSARTGVGSASKFDPVVFALFGCRISPDLDAGIKLPASVEPRDFEIEFSAAVRRTIRLTGPKQLSKSSIKLLLHDVAGKKVLTLTIAVPRILGYFPILQESRSS